MKWFKKRPPKSEGYKLHKVFITYEVLVNAKNETHALNLIRELREDLWEVTRSKKYILKFAVNEIAEAKKL